MKLEQLVRITVSVLSRFKPKYVFIEKNEEGNNVAIARDDAEQMLIILELPECEELDGVELCLSKLPYLEKAFALYDRSAKNNQYNTFSFIKQTDHRGNPVISNFVFIAGKTSIDYALTDKNVMTQRYPKKLKVSVKTDSTVYSDDVKAFKEGVSVFSLGVSDKSKSYCSPEINNNDHLVFSLINSDTSVKVSAGVDHKVDTVPEDSAFSIESFMRAFDAVSMAGEGHFGYSEKVASFSCEIDGVKVYIHVPALKRVR